MLRVHRGGGVDLEHVVVLPSILKQTVHWVQHLVGQLEEPLTGGAAVVQPLLPTEHYVQPPPQVLRLEPHYLGMKEWEQVNWNEEMENGRIR